MTVAVTIDGTDVTTKVLEGLSITYGRTDVSTPVADPTTCTFSVVRESSLGTISNGLLEVGLPVEVEKNGSRRFTGQIADVTIDRYTATIVAVSGLLDRLGRAEIVLPPTSTGTMATGTAVAVIATQVEEQGKWGTVPTWDISAGTTTVTVEEQTAGPVELLQAVTISEPAGVLYERLDPPAIVWRDAEARRDIVADVTISPTRIGLDYTASRRVGQKVNRALVGWTGGVAEVVVAADLAAEGEYPSDLSTWLSNNIDAELLAARLVGNYVSPEWSFETLFVPVSELTGAQQTAVLGLEVGSILRTVPNVEPGLASRYFVEGWTEVLGTTRWEITFTVSDVRLSRAPQRWHDVDLGISWADAFDSGTTWIEALRTYLGEVSV